MSLTTTARAGEPVWVVAWAVEEVWGKAWVVEEINELGKRIKAIECDNKNLDKK